jgi:hypothetical protein
VLTLDLLEFLGSVLVVLPLVGEENALVVELLRRLVGGDAVVLPKQVREAAARARRQRERNQQQQPQAQAQAQAAVGRG